MNDFIQIYPNFLCEDEYSKLSSALRLLQQSICTDDNKSYEAETIIRKSKLRNIPDEYVFYSHYLSRILKSECNIFFQDALFLKQNKNGIPNHVDTQVSDRLVDINCNIDHTPVCVNIFYVNVPEDFQGGDLIVEGQENVTISPTNNMLVEFSGHSSMHHVMPFETQSYRCMLVTEQCKLSTPNLILHGSKIEMPFTVNEIKKDRYGQFE